MDPLDDLFDGVPGNGRPVGRLIGLDSKAFGQCRRPRAQTRDPGPRPEPRPRPQIETRKRASERASKQASKQASSERC